MDVYKLDSYIDGKYGHDLSLYEKASADIFELELYKSKVILEDDNKFCYCFKEIYKKALTLIEFILMAKVTDRKLTYGCVSDVLPYVDDVDRRALILSYVLLRPIFKDMIRTDTNELVNRLWQYVKAIKLTLAGIHIDCNNLMCAHSCDNNECYYIRSNNTVCPKHEEIAGSVEYIRIYVNEYIIYQRKYWLKYFVTMLHKLHRNFDDVWVILDYKNIKFNYKWNEESWHRFKIVKEHFGDRICIINYSNVDFGDYFDEIKDYLTTESEVEFLKKVA